MAVIAQFSTVRPEMASSRTYKDFYNFIGQHANNFGVVARLYQKHTMSYFTEAFGNVIGLEGKASSKFQPLDTMKYEWEVETTEIKRIPFAATVSSTYQHTHGVEIPMTFTERYYEVNDTFMIDGSHQLCYVVDGPIHRSADNSWEYQVRLVDSSINAELLVDYCKEGMTTRWIGNIQPEFHEMGTVKYTSNFNKFTGWLQELRCDVDASSRYLDMEDSFVKVQEEGVGAAKSHTFKLPGMKRVLLDNFMEARNNAMLWNKSTMDEHGKCLLHDRQGRDIICGDGLVAQISRYCGKTNYAKLTEGILKGIIQDLAEKCEESMGNTFTFVVNDILFSQLQSACADFLFKHRVMEEYLYSKFEGDKIKVGATYSAFEWMGNKIVFKLDRALSNEYPTSGYGILVDLTADSVSGMSPIQAVTMKGKQMMQNDVNGVGVKPGSVATPVAGQKMVVSGYIGILAANPYRSHILIQNK